MIAKEKNDPTVNACKLCSPLGASFVFKGIENCIPLLHGSQGCSTYIRRYMIGHFREPIDIASTNFGEETAIFGGRENLTIALDNIIKAYKPSVIGIATTCLSETIGDDVPMYLGSYVNDRKDLVIPKLVHVSTPSYKGTHQDGFYATINSLIETIAEGGEKTKTINFIMNLFSPADIRWFKELSECYNIESIIMPDYSDTLDGEYWGEYKRMPEGGTKIEDIQKMGRSIGTIEFGNILSEKGGAGEILESKFGVKSYGIGFPVGITNTDYFFSLLESITDTKLPEKYRKERGLLIDSYVDGHKYLFGKKAVLYGEDDLVLGLASFIRELGMIPVVIGTGRKTGLLEKVINEVIPDYKSLNISIIENIDFEDIGRIAQEKEADILIGHSKGYKVARDLNIPLIRVGFPIHDRIGGQRVRVLGYQGTQELLDRIINAIIEKKQSDSPVGYMAM
ncbi:MAG: nitrogenase [Spirochaetes bacterium GWF1_31_7]|nr:MAG: nitrogenase [Spirochaetes bacterium GWE1_32_154]OHD46964.1 MAG: nitrogenase [Spirochaetes bacterium GWF1_31_7]OHD49744.1 MAG: nitrogenase [Spirochaetes bacterium GWE2_31_10]OHD80121.1 MAG: nitrogenase [Spirochaetes bacterium RIFOXYB1_FULL_32_8]HBD95528.1 nitrogenase [Spirochaetia bacterium]